MFDLLHNTVVEVVILSIYSRLGSNGNLQIGDLL